MSRSRMSPQHIQSEQEQPIASKIGANRNAITSFRESAQLEWVDPPLFSEAFQFHMDRYGDNSTRLRRAIIKPKEVIYRRTLEDWRCGRTLPSTAKSYELLERVAHRYSLPKSYFADKLAPFRAASRRNELLLSRSERRRLAWHLPADFNRRSAREQAEILHWVRANILSNGTDYSQFLSRMMKDRYRLRFPATLTGGYGRTRKSFTSGKSSGEGPLAAPAVLVLEVTDLIAFKTSTITRAGALRRGRWNERTSQQKVQHLAIMFGALHADPAGPIQGLGVPMEALTLAILLIPAVWDWYLQWRQKRRGFYTRWEADMLALGQALVRADTGWLRQNSDFAVHLKPILGLITAQEIERISANWDAECEAIFKYLGTLFRDIRRVQQVHRDPFEPILPVLESPSPVRTYRRIANELIARLPDQRRHPRARAEAVRGFLLLRLALHFGLRQRNLRELLLCPPGEDSRSLRELRDLKRGEIRWIESSGKWEMLIPSEAFKNANSSFFAARPLKLELPDVDALYEHLASYVGVHRHLLLQGATDPGTFFVKSAKATSRNASYDGPGFYEAWRELIQRYGIYNPYTKRGAIEGLLPHGPHCVRDVLATHILKRTGSYEQASYAIHDTPAVVARHYCRFLPGDKAAIAAEVLSEAWEGL